MKWEGGRRGGGVEDRRGLGGGAMAGGGIGVAVLALIGYFFFGIDPQTTTQLASQFGGAEAGADLDRLDRVDAHHRLGKVGVELAVDRRAKAGDREYRSELPPPAALPKAGELAAVA